MEETVYHSECTRAQGIEYINTEDDRGQVGCRYAYNTKARNLA